ncbi:MAG TPA: hypothetical protein PK385_06930 [Spirochaetota bacterium]|nr:hypothetical protein [Spirochaetota bacterium]HOS31823.1 hypothetical protein [Spirochaetota bacterium]HOS55777.1 hypothetical protein [Spirochaetota bacterium]HPK62689.1 hypothetical protein [Spirochaetota bacterium]HQF76711.1 hypothetical protein [Spirochaetota bacterium]
MENKKSEYEIIYDYLIKEGFHEVTEEDEKNIKYQDTNNNISCKYETEEEFLGYCKKGDCK